MKLPESYLVLFNIAKKTNFGNLIRTANAFGVTEVIIVGRRAYYEFGSFGTAGHTRKRHAYTLEDAVAMLRERGCTICGVEIVDQAVPVHEHPFHGPTAFMMGNEGLGLNERQIAHCDQFVYIPQYGTGASLNVNVAAGIVLHQFAVWAQLVESRREGCKFIAQTSGTRPSSSSV